MTVPSFQNIGEHYADLTRRQKELLDLLLANPEGVCYATLKELSERCGVSEVTILRMCKRLGFDSFVELKQVFREHTERLVKNNTEATFFSLNLPAAERGDKAEALRQIMENGRQQSNRFFDAVPEEKLLKTARDLIAARTVLICGQGISGLVAEYLYRRISPLLSHAILVKPEDIDSVQASLCKLQPKDQVVAISFPRYFDSVQKLVLYAEHIGAGVTTITNAMDSPVVTPGSTNYLCNTATKVFYNSYSLPMELVNLIASAIVLEMESGYDSLVAKAHEVIHYINDVPSEG